MVDLALQITLVVLLLLTITWCVMVHHRLRRLRADRDEMAAFVTALGEATARAVAAVQQMREANHAIEGTAQEQARRARRESEDLARLMDNALRVIKRLDAAVERGATRVAELRTMPASPEGAARDAPVPVDAPQQRRAAEAALPPREPPTPGRQSGTSDRLGTGARRPMVPVRREGQLDGLLHGELLEALQGLR